MNGWLWNFAMYVGYHDANNVSNFDGGPVTQLIFFNVLYYYLRCFTDMALHSHDAITVSAAVATRLRADCSSMEGHTSLSTALVYYPSDVTILSKFPDMLQKFSALPVCDVYNTSQTSIHTRGTVVQWLRPQDLQLRCPWFESCWRHFASELWQFCLFASVFRRRH